jgi:6-phospho-3-hexuloisomerase
VSVKDTLAAILLELSTNQAMVDESRVQSLVDEIAGARHVFLAGAGRSGVVIMGLANRLLQLGKSVSVVGDITSPHSRAGDLLIIGSGSGETQSLIVLAHKAKTTGARIGVVTMDEHSTIAKLADIAVVLPGVSPKLKRSTAVTSIQPMGSAFEQMTLLTYDAVIVELMVRVGESADSMFARHADLE